MHRSYFYLHLFFNATPTTGIYTLSLHDALPISGPAPSPAAFDRTSSKRSGKTFLYRSIGSPREKRDRKSTRLNSSHDQISYAVFCLKKKKIPRKIGVLVVK